jgi:Na+/melibiose symporter-like transporter
MYSDGSTRWIVDMLANDDALFPRCSRTRSSSSARPTCSRARRGRSGGSAIGSTNPCVKIISSSISIFRLLRYIHAWFHRVLFIFCDVSLNSFCNINIVFFSRYVIRHSQCIQVIVQSMINIHLCYCTIKSFVLVCSISNSKIFFARGNKAPSIMYPGYCAIDQHKFGLLYNQNLCISLLHL